jgi:hypothetical protein
MNDFDLLSFLLGAGSMWVMMTVEEYRRELLDFAAWAWEIARDAVTWLRRPE